MAVQIANQAGLAVDAGEDEKFAIVFGAMGIKNDVAAYFKHSFEQSGVLEKVVMFQNLADDPVVERIITPRCALTAAEYLAFYEGMHVLVKHFVRFLHLKEKFQVEKVILDICIPILQVYMSVQV